MYLREIQSRELNERQRDSYSFKWKSNGERLIGIKAFGLRFSFTLKETFLPFQPERRQEKRKNRESLVAFIRWESILERNSNDESVSSSISSLPLKFCLSVSPCCMQSCFNHKPTMKLSFASLTLSLCLYFLSFWLSVANALQFVFACWDERKLAACLSENLNVNWVTNESVKRSTETKNCNPQPNRRSEKRKNHPTDEIHKHKHNLPPSLFPPTNKNFSLQGRFEAHKCR